MRSSHQLALLLIFLVLSSSTSSYSKESSTSPEVGTLDKVKYETNTLANTSADTSKLPLPSQNMLDEVLCNVKSFRVIDSGLGVDGKLCATYSDLLREKSSGKVIFESSEPFVLENLIRYFRIAEGNQFPEDSRNFLGTSTFELTLVDGRRVHIGLVGSNLRWNAWRYDAYLLHPVGLIIWLGEHGAMRPLREIEARFDYAKYIHKRDIVGFDEFARSMPKSLRDFLGAIKRLESSASLEDMSEKYGAIPYAKRLKLARAALSRQFPNESDQIEVLLQWDGKIHNARSSYQRFPIELLLEYDPKQILSKVKQSSLSRSQWVGLIRYYSDLDFRQRFPSGYKPLNKALRDRIIKEVSATGKNSLDVDDFKSVLENWIP